MVFAYIAFGYESACAMWHAQRGNTYTLYEQALPRPQWQPGQLLADIPLPVFDDFETPSKVAQLAMLEQRAAIQLF